MRFLLTMSLLIFVLLLQNGPAYAVGSVKPEVPAKEAVDTKTAVKETKLSRKEKRAQRKEFRKQLKEAVKSAKASDTDFLLLVIIAILIPPLGMFLYDGVSNRFWISLILTLLFFVPGLIYTLIVILGEN